jgi:hypothetical protein
LVDKLRFPAKEAACFIKVTLRIIFLNGKNGDEKRIGKEQSIETTQESCRSFVGFFEADE